MDGAILAGLVGGGVVIIGNALVWVFGFGRTISRVETKCDSFTTIINGKGGIKDNITEIKEELVRGSERMDTMSNSLASLEGSVNTYMEIKKRNGKRSKTNRGVE